MLAARGISLCIGYIFGMFLSGYFVGKTKDVDIRKQGSGNVGTTNTLRILGMKAGVFTLICDCIKPILAILVVWLLFHQSYFAVDTHMLCFYAGIGTVLGHDFPFYMKFKGGKGVASSAGLMLVLFPKLFIGCLIVFVLAVGITRYVSLGSILCGIMFPLQMIIFAQMGWLEYTGTQLIEVQVMAVLLGALVIFLHRANIGRLIHGTENKLSFHKK